jgi:hypothetical protein
MMYGKDKGQMSASTMRAISKKKPLINAGAKPVEVMPKAKKKPKNIRPVLLINAKPDPRGLAGAAARMRNDDVKEAMDRAVRKAMGLE